MGDGTGASGAGPHRGLAHALMAGSGFAGLAYQIVWTQQVGLWLGHESAAVFAVIAAFFGGLAAGAFLLGTRIEASRFPVRWYAACEACIGAWAVALVFLAEPAAASLRALSGHDPSPVRQWLTAFLGLFIVLLPATAAMGATLPAMARILALSPRSSRSVASLYAANTAGAVAGVLAGAFWLVPEIGLSRTTLACAGLNFVVALLAVRALPEPARQPVRAIRGHASLTLLAMTGLLGIGYEVLAVRALAQVAENTVYTFAVLLAVYLVGTAAGASVWAWLAARDEAVTRWRERLLLGLCATTLLGLFVLAAAPAIKRSLLASLGPGFTPALLAEALLALAAFALPTMLMGALFSLLADEARSRGEGLGRAIAANTLGAAFAAPVFGVALVPLGGTAFAFIILATGYLALAATRFSPAFAATALATLVVAIRGPSLRLVDVAPGANVVEYREGVLAAVSVIEDEHGVRRLHINNRQQEGSSATRLADGRQALLPLLLHPEPHRALFLGLGTGVTATVATADPGLVVEAVELLPEVVAASARFRDGNEARPADARLRVHVADARRFVRTSPQRYDVIVSDNFHPARSGSAALYTAEHFAAVRDRLAPGGLFCQWLPLHQLDLRSLRGIVRSFLAAFPEGVATLATYSLETPVIGLVGLREGNRFDADHVRSRLQSAGPHWPASAYGVEDDLALFGGFFAGPASLARFAARAAANTDDHPWVAYRAPRLTYAPDSRPADRLATLMREVDLGPGELFTSGTATADRNAKITAYWNARNRFLAAGRDVRPVSDPALMLAKVREPLLEVLRTSPDFRPAYDPLRRLARATAATDPEGSRALLTQLDAIRPR